jgi:hypothetical protein
MKKHITLTVGKEDRKIQQETLRDIQSELFKDKGHLSNDDLQIVDALISHVVCGRENKWELDDLKLGDLKVKDDGELGASMYIINPDTEKIAWVNAKGIDALLKWLQVKTESSQ